MSHNSKNARLVRERNARKRAKVVNSKGHIESSGPNGPKKTMPKHGKTNAWWQKPQRPRAWWAGKAEAK